MQLKKPTRSTATKQRVAHQTKPTSYTPSVSENLHERIAARAYEIYEQRICQGALDDWLQAEQEILGQKKTQNADMPHRGGYASNEQD
jgi:Protein of unknown function (DUF2934)